MDGVDRQLKMDGEDKSTETDPLRGLVQPVVDTTNPNRAVLYDTKHGVYLTFTIQEMKTSFCRAALRIFFVGLTILLFICFWDLCDICILIVTLAACAAPCVGLSFLQPMCTAGIVACLWKGFTVASSIAEVHVQWKL
jgi:hypothetical protein